MADASDLPEVSIPTTTVERLAYAGGRVADEVADLRIETRESIAELRQEIVTLRTAQQPSLDAWELTQKRRLDESLAYSGFRAEFWKAVSRPAVIMAILTALLSGLGLGSQGERIASAAAIALKSYADDGANTTKIEVHDARDSHN